MINCETRTPRRAFTLVEMLTVVVIVAILVGILVPTVNRARVKARETVTRATVATLSTGLDTFRADQRIGGAYPPSASDLINGNRYMYGVTDPRGRASLLPTEISGASLLVWALAGADLLGCPGFRPFGVTPFWAHSTGADYNQQTPERSGAYALYPQNHARAGQPVHQRAAPYVDMGKIKVTRYDDKLPVRGASGAGGYVIDAEQKASETMGLGAGPERRFPFFLDGFGAPILYFRADAAGTIAADLSPDEPLDPQNPQRGIYHFLDNGALLASGAQYLGRSGPPGTRQQPLQLRAKASAERPHNLTWQPTTITLGTQALSTRQFMKYIRNKNVTAKLQPANADSYLLISAGEDGNFGTGDDIANFEHNGGELVPGG